MTGPAGLDLRVFVGSGGVGKTTLAAGAAIQAALRGRRTLVMTFDPSHRLKDALGLPSDAGDRAVPVRVRAPGSLDASLLDARATFDRLVLRYAPDPLSARRILQNPFYVHLAGHLGGILEYMAVERLFEVAEQGDYDTIVLDTPPTSQALDFLEAPDRILGFLESGVVRLVRRDWFDEAGRLRPARKLGPLGRSVEQWVDRAVGLELLRSAAEFFQAFGPLYEGFRQRAEEVRELLRAPGTRFVLVTAAAPDRVADAMFFARRLREAGFHLERVVANRVHPLLPDAEEDPPALREGLHLLRRLGRTDARGVAMLQDLLADTVPLSALPLLAEDPTDLAALEALGARLALTFPASA